MVVTLSLGEFNLTWMPHTPLTNIIAGLEAPDPGGVVRFDGCDMTAVPIERRNVGMVFQSYALFPNMSVADNVGYGLKIRGLPKAERVARVAELVALTNIAGLEHRRVDHGDLVLPGGRRPIGGDEAVRLIPSRHQE